MGQQLSPEQAELYRRVDEVLHYLWDPIGVSRFPGARNEYLSYLPRVFVLLVDRVPDSEIVAFLVKTASETMGLSRTRRMEEDAKEVVSILMNYRDFIHKRTNT